jgi:hypothetical protein
MAGLRLKMFDYHLIFFYSPHPIHLYSHFFNFLVQVQTENESVGIISLPEPENHEILNLSSGNDDGNEVIPEGETIGRFKVKKVDSVAMFRVTFG